MKTKLLMLTAVMSCVFAGNAMGLRKTRPSGKSTRSSARTRTTASTAKASTAALPAAHSGC